MISGINGIFNKITNKNYDDDDKKEEFTQQTLLPSWVVMVCLWVLYLMIYIRLRSYHLNTWSLGWMSDSVCFLLSVAVPFTAIFRNSTWARTSAVPVLLPTVIVALAAVVVLIIIFEIPRLIAAILRRAAAAPNAKECSVVEKCLRRAEGVVTGSVTPLAPGSMRGLATGTVLA